jgi:hypothetical protein
MSTMVDLSEAEIAELKALTKQTDVAAAIRAAMTEYIRYIKRMQLKQLSGKLQMEDNWSELERAEIEPGHENSGSGPD